MRPRSCRAVSGFSAQRLDHGGDVGAGDRGYRLVAQRPRVHVEVQFPVLHGLGMAEVRRKLLQHLVGEVAEQGRFLALFQNRVVAVGDRRTQPVGAPAGFGERDLGALCPGCRAEPLRPLAAVLLPDEQPLPRCRRLHVEPQVLPEPVQLGGERPVDLLLRGDPVHVSPILSPARSPTLFYGAGVSSRRLAEATYGQKSREINYLCDRRGSAEVCVNASGIRVMNRMTGRCRRRDGRITVRGWAMSP